MLNFLKYQGAGNDFILIDNRDGKYDNLRVDQIQQVCDRRFGIGADGLIKINACSGYDFEVDYYNADGSKSFCGNGARCSVAFAKYLGIKKEKYSFMAIDGVHEAYFQDDLICLKMNDVLDYQRDETAFVIHTGSPHYIQFVENLGEIDVFQEGKKIRYNETYNGEGINVNFIQSATNKGLKIRTYERGVEDETLSCGTGITAAALAWSVEKELYGEHTIPVEALGGNLQVSYVRSENGHFSNIWLIGPAAFVFSGSIHV